MLVAVQLSVSGSYLPPVFTKLKPLNPPQTIISLPVQEEVLTDWRRGRVGGAGSRPTIRAGVISPACVGQRTGVATPDDHFSCRSTPPWD